MISFDLSASFVQAAIDTQQVNFEIKLEASSYHLDGDAGSTSTGTLEPFE